MRCLDGHSDVQERRPNLGTTKGAQHEETGNGLRGRSGPRGHDGNVPVVVAK
jgi:hypothetical protein